MGIIQRQAFKNSILTYTGLLIGAFSLLIVQPRFLTKQEIGLTRILFSFSSLIATFIPLGINAVVLRFFPLYRDTANKHHGFLGFVLLIPLFSFVLFGGALMLLQPFIISKYQAQSALFTEFYTCVYPLVFFLAIINILLAYSNSIYRTAVPTLLNDILVRIVSIVLFALYFFKWVSLQLFVWLYIGIYGLQLVSLLVYIVWIDSSSFSPNWGKYPRSQLYKMFRYGFLMSFAALASLGIKYLDAIMLGVYKPLQAGLGALDIVGIYSIAMFIATFVEAPLNAMDKIYTPKIADAWSRNDMVDILYNYQNSATYLAVLGGLLFLLINLNIDSFFQLIPDKDFSLGKSVVLFISLGTLINMSFGNNDSIIWTSHKYYYLTLILFSAFLFSFIGYIFFIPHFGMNGAAITTLCSVALSNLLKFIFIWKLFGMQPFTSATIKSLLLTGFIFAIFYFISFPFYPIINIGIKSILISGIYLVSIYKFKIAPLLFEMLFQKIPFFPKKH